MFDNGGNARLKFSYDFRLLFDTLTDKFAYRIYSINRPGRLLNFWTLRVGAY